MEDHLQPCILKDFRHIFIRPLLSDEKSRILLSSLGCAAARAWHSPQSIWGTLTTFTSTAYLPRSSCCLGWGNGSCRGFLLPTTISYNWCLLGSLVTTQNGNMFSIEIVSQTNYSTNLANTNACQAKLGF